MLADALRFVVHLRAPQGVAGQITIPTARAALFTACAIGLAVLATSAWQRHADPATARPVLAVGYIRDLASGATTTSSPRASLTDMLATSLGRLPALQVIASSRMLELMPRDADTSRPVIVAAARRAGATEIVEGELLPMADGQLRLQVRRVNAYDRRDCFAADGSRYLPGRSNEEIFRPLRPFRRETSQAG